MCKSLLLLALLGATPQWELIWSDEFDKDGPPNPEYWNVATGFRYNKEAQYYTDRPSNVRVEDGKLILEAIKETYPNARYDPESDKLRFNTKEAHYTSGLVDSKNKAEWTGGRIEVRAKLPQGRGVWPAIWMLGSPPDGRRWPNQGEIDIMEFVGYQPGHIHGTIHTEARNHKLKNGKPGKIVTDADLHNEFHTYALEWTPDRLDWFFDGEKFHSDFNEGKGVAQWPFVWPHYLILNVAIGGSWGGRKGIDDTIFPQRMEVDWVRVYKPAGANETAGDGE